jgi:large subunit ribosomal protein L16
MAIMPKRVKYRKAQRGTIKGVSTRGNELSFGEFGLKALENSWMKNNQIESIRVAITRKLRRGGKLWIRAFPDKPVTKKPAETRMGKGKGELSHWVAVVKRGKVIMELGGIPEELARQVFRLAAYKLPFSTKFIKRSHA